MKADKKIRDDYYIEVYLCCKLYII